MRTRVAVVLVNAVKGPGMSADGSAASVVIVRLSPFSTTRTVEPAPMICAQSAMFGALAKVVVSALLARWRERESAANQAMSAPASPDPRTDLELLLANALAHSGADLENMRFELALRGLGRRDPAVATMLGHIPSALA